MPETAGPDLCGCDPCECDPEEKAKYDEKDLCGCAPCECDLSEKPKEYENELCGCATCDCDPPSNSGKENEESGERKCPVCESRGHFHGKDGKCSTCMKRQSKDKNGWCATCESRVDYREGLMARNYRNDSEEMAGEDGYGYGIETDSDYMGEYGCPQCRHKPSEFIQYNDADAKLYDGDQTAEEEEEEEDDECSDRRRQPTPVPSDHTFENLNQIRKEFCKSCFPKNLGMTLTEDLLLEILIKNPYGDFEMLLPGNQIYPGLLKSRVTDDDMPQIVSVLLEVRNITRLNLCYNEISDAGMEIFAPALQECGNLIELDLMHNNLTAAGILSICKALLHRAPLHSLKLTGMKIGDEGMYALTCLILSGRAPLDLDIGECDLTCEGFQSLCSALHAMDHDIDYPNYLLLKNNLPMELVRLKESKTEYNEEVEHVTQLNRKSSQPTFVRVKTDVLGGQSNDHRPSSSGPGHGCEEIQFPELFESFSATILQGLFDLRHRFSEEDIDDKQELWNDPAYQIDQLVADAQSILPSVSQIIDTFQKQKSGERHDDDEETFEERERVLISKSLYTLEPVDEEDIMDPIAQERNHEAHGLNHGLGGNGSDVDLHDDVATPDSYTAEAAASFMVRDTIYSAAKSSRKSEYMDKSDITQLLLLTVIETIEKINKKQNLNITEDDCHRILEDAMEKVYRKIKPRIPPDCKLDKDDINCFFRTIFSVSQGTFLHLLENPFVAQALVEHGTSGCIETESGRREKITQAQQGAMTEEQIRRISISFLHGVFIEAARVIGVASPFGIEENVENDLTCTELKIEGEVDYLMEKAAQIAIATKDKAHEVEETANEFTTAADNFVLDLFENVNNLVMDTEIKNRVVETPAEINGPTVYKYVSRPTRLVLNRPIFGEAKAHVMAAKLGDYLGLNTSVAALHAQKWDLGEDGMAALMENLVENKTLVVLDLANNKLNADGMKLLATFIMNNPSLKHLVLHHNGIRDAGMAHLNLAISSGCSLCSLDIAYNGITYRELDPLLTSIPSTRIRALYMWGNKFGPDSWNIMRTLYEGKILNPNYSDVIIQRVGQEKMVVKNMQVRDINEYYEVPAVLDNGLHLPPSFTDDSYKVRHREPTAVAT